MINGCYFNCFMNNLTNHYRIKNVSLICSNKHSTILYIFSDGKNADSDLIKNKVSKEDVKNTGLE